MKKKVLIITYYWPPAGGPGVQRWLKFVKYLPDFDIEPIVFIPENPAYPLIDESLVSEVPSDINIIKHPIKEPYKLAGVLSKKSSKTISKGIIPDKNKQSNIEKLLLYIRGNFFIPDARVSWVKPSVKFLLDYLKKEEISSIVTSGPPHSLHLIGLKLKEELNVSWLADFRDPWTSIGYHKDLKLNALAKKKHKHYESQVLNSADQIVVTSFSTKEEFLRLTKKPIAVITNGYDDEKHVKVEMDSKFSLAHIGSLLSRRNPEVLWRVLKDLVDENSSLEDNLQINFVGAVSKDVLKSLEQFGLNAYVNQIGYVSHKEAISYQKKSQVLLLIEIDSEETKSIIPGKLFEYMVSGRPILGIGPLGSDVEQIIAETNTGKYYSYADYEPLKKLILDYYKAFQNNELQVHPIGLQKFHRKSLTKSLAKLL